MPAYYNEIDPMFKAYLITNTANGKRYVGITTKGISTRWSAHVAESKHKRGGWAIHRAIAKYSVDAFRIEWIASSYSWADLCSSERILIRQWGTRVPKGYNLTIGGDGVIGLSAETRAIMASKNRGRKHTEEAKRIIGLAGIGRARTQRAKEAIGAAHRGKPLTEEHRKKLSLVKTGKRMPVRSQEHKEKIAAGLRRAWERRKAAQ